MIKKIISYYNPFKALHFKKSNLDNFYQIKEGNKLYSFEQIREFNSDNINELEPFISRWQKLTLIMFISCLSFFFLGLKIDSIHLFFIGMFLLSVTVSSFSVTILLVAVYKNNKSHLITEE